MSLEADLTAAIFRVHARVDYLARRARAEIHSMTVRNRRSLGQRIRWARSKLTPPSDPMPAVFRWRNHDRQGRQL